MLSSLYSLDLYATAITGMIPSEIGMLSFLTVLDLRSNSITGTIPTELCALTDTVIYCVASEISCSCIDSSYIEVSICN